MDSAARVMVTGGAGFIGTHLIEALLTRGDRVLCLDDLSSGDAGNMARFRDHPGFVFRQHDITEVIQGPFDIDQIYNLACPASPAHYQRAPIQTVRTTVIGALNVLEFADRAGATVLQASTSEVYGDPTVHPQTESYWGNVNPTGPRACYDEGKRCAETLFFDFHRQYGAKIKVARVFNTFGPYMRSDDGRIVSNFIVAALGGRPLSVYGDGTQTRSFCYVSDMVAGLIRLMDAPADRTGPINLGNATETSVLDLAELVLRLTGSRAGVAFHPLPQDDPRRRNPDITRAKRDLDWEPLVDLETGLQHTIAYFRALAGHSDTGAA